MNLNKARDFYSAYFEGTLDEGLRQAFERAMASDARITAEYRQFVRIMGELKEVQAPVEVPANLHLKIRERVDAHIISVERKAQTANRFFAWRPIAYGALATLAIIGVVASFSSLPGMGRPATAGIVASVDEAPALTYRDGTVSLRFSAARENTVTVTGALDGRPIAKQTLVGQRLVCPLTNKGADAVVVSLSFARDYSTLYVAVPGVKPDAATDGAGTVLDLAAAIASRYAVPVVVDAASPGVHVAWELEGVEALASVSDELKALGLKAEIRESGLVWISSN
jgi:hypothetical protein